MATAGGWYSSAMRDLPRNPLQCPRPANERQRDRAKTETKDTGLRAGVRLTAVAGSFDHGCLCVYESCVIGGLSERSEGERERECCSMRGKGFPWLARGRALGIC